MTNKEYKKALEEAKEYNWYTDGLEVDYNPWARREYNTFLNADRKRELRESMRGMKKLPGCNDRACVVDDGKEKVLRSYFTDVATIKNGRLVKTWRGYSNTTKKHIDEFCYLYGFPVLSKRQWIALKPDRAYTKKELEQIREEN